jgi:L-threonylcarbamoyladenylate synthase
METNILPVNIANIGQVTARTVPGDVLDELDFQVNPDSVDARNLQQAAQNLRTSDVPVAFPTETVYGLGADATRSTAVKGIYKAKQRPSDNPLIVHFYSLNQLRSLLQHPKHAPTKGVRQDGATEDPIPAIYGPLISKFWPGPLTIILPNSSPSQLAPEVTAGLKTFGARIPKHPLALALLALADVPVAAPSANASTKPSPTAAEHVAHDLDGRIEIILDGGPCDVGVESTVVDGLSQPPLVLRPGGISLEQIRTCPGWENTQIGYKNVSEKDAQPKAPGMKYRHYSPKATVVLFEAGRSPPTTRDFESQLGPRAKLGIIRTSAWEIASRGQALAVIQSAQPQADQECNGSLPQENLGFAGMLESLDATQWTKSLATEHSLAINDQNVTLLDIELGRDYKNIARGIFSALRDLDKQDVDAIFVEGIDETQGHTAAAIMNRLRKAAEVHVDG